jgi:hypothetical protein
MAFVKMLVSIARQTSRHDIENQDQLNFYFLWESCADIVESASTWYIAEDYRSRLLTTGIPT